MKSIAYHHVLQVGMVLHLILLFDDMLTLCCMVDLTAIVQLFQCQSGNLSILTHSEEEVAALTSMFPTTPLRILEGVFGEKDWDPEQLPVNRKRRRRISKAKRMEEVGNCRHRSGQSNLLNSSM